MKVSLIIITYNTPGYLGLVLESVRRQSTKPYEVIIADDGSTHETRDMIDSLRDNYPCTLKHVWHEDNGFRISSIRNKAIHEAKGDYLIFSDGDLMLHKHFIKDFVSVAKNKMVYIGTRLFINQSFTKKLLSCGVNYSSFNPIFGKSEKNWLNGLRIPSVYNLFKIYDKPSTSLRGGLVGMYLSDMIAIGGWDEIYEGWGSEDTDMLARMINNGLKARKLKHMGLTYHLWHPHNSRSSQNKNEYLLEECIREKRVKAIKGLLL